MRRLFFVIIVFTYCLSMGTAFGLTDQQQESLDTNTEYYQPNADSGNCSDTGTTTTDTTPSTTSHSTWNSTAQPPYYLEEFIINVLQDIAQKKGVPKSDAVTQEHVVALLGWGYAEGGNIANTGAFNIWNTGLTDRPDLLAGAGNGSGLESFNSFNSGVEANAISMTLPQYSRIGKILTQSGSTAEQVEHTIAYYNETPNNLAWAWGNDPNDPSAVLQFNQTTYITSLLDQLNQARQNYAQEASVVIGPGEEDTSHVPASQLQFTGGKSNVGSVGSATSTCASSLSIADCKSVVGDAKILCAAQPYAGIYYEYGGGHESYSAFIAGCPDPSNPPNNQPNGGPINGDLAGLSGNPSPCATDCSGLVSIAVDAAFGQNFSWTVSTLETDTANWKQIDEGNVQPGDVVVIGSDHVEIVDHYDAATGVLYTFGSHETGTQTGVVSSTLSNWTGAYRYIGPGSGGK